MRRSVAKRREGGKDQRRGRVAAAAPGALGNPARAGRADGGVEGSEPPGIGNSRISGPSRVAVLGFVLMHF